MAYEKNTWANGDIITAEKLNNMEDGIAESGGESAKGIIVEFDFYENPNNVYDKRLISKTEIVSAIDSFKSGGVVLFHLPEVSGQGLPEVYAAVDSYFPNATYYSVEAGAEKETERLCPDEKRELGILRFDTSYVDDSGYYNIDIYVD